MAKESNYTSHHYKGKSVLSHTATEKGTVKIPVEIRRRYNLKKGSKGKFIETKYVSTNLVRDLSSKEDELTSLSEVTRKRPKAHGSSVEIIASRRRGRNTRLSR